MASWLIARSGLVMNATDVIVIGEKILHLYFCHPIQWFYPTQHYLISITRKEEFHNKSQLSQGATIKTDEDTGKIVIARVMHGGAADRSGLIHAGDEVIEVNGFSVENKTPADVLTILVRELVLRRVFAFKIFNTFTKYSL